MFSSYRRPFKGRASMWPRAAALAALASGLLLGHRPVDAQALPPLTLDAALAAAEARSMALPAQTGAALAARERAVAAGQRPDPVLRLGLDNLPIEGSTDHLLTREPTTARSIGIVQSLPAAAKLAARAQRFEQDARVAEARRQALRAALRRETALAWLAAQTEVRRLQLIKTQREESLRAQEAAAAAYRAGRGAQADLFVARAVSARLDDRRLQAELALANALSSLRRWIGDAAGQPLAPALALLPTVPAAGEAPASGLAALAAEDPELRLASAREDAAQSQAEVAREERSADWSVDLRFAQRGPRFDNMVSLGFSIPLRWDLANRQDRELAARLAELEQARADTEELRRTRGADLERWRQGYRAGLARLANLDSALLPLAASRTEAALTAYRSGSGNLQSVFDARGAELALQFERLQIELETASDQARLDTLIPPPEAAR